jgi:heme-degrading monooxygenase HmoA
VIAMTEQNAFWASGNWHVADGRADEFMDRWTAFLDWTKAANPGFEGARLVRDTSDPNHFVSFASWRDSPSWSAWREQPEFAQHFGGIRALCTEVSAGGYEVVRTV